MKRIALLIIVILLLGVQAIDAKKASRKKSTPPKNSPPQPPKPSAPSSQNRAPPSPPKQPKKTPPTPTTTPSPTSTPAPKSTVVTAQNPSKPVPKQLTDEDMHDAFCTLIGVMIIVASFFFPTTFKKELRGWYDDGLWWMLTFAALAWFVAVYMHAFPTIKAKVTARWAATSSENSGSLVVLFDDCWNWIAAFFHSIMSFPCTWCPSFICDACTRGKQLVLGALPSKCVGAIAGLDCCQILWVTLTKEAIFGFIKSIICGEGFLLLSIWIAIHGFSKLGALCISVVFIFMTSFVGEDESVYGYSLAYGEPLMVYLIVLFITIYGTHTKTVIPMFSLQGLSSILVLEVLSYFHPKTAGHNRYWIIICAIVVLMIVVLENEVDRDTALPLSLLFITNIYFCFASIAMTVFDSYDMSMVFWVGIGIAFFARMGMILAFLRDMWRQMQLEPNPAGKLKADP